MSLHEGMRVAYQGWENGRPKKVEWTDLGTIKGRGSCVVWDTGEADSITPTGWCGEHGYRVVPIRQLWPFSVYVGDAHEEAVLVFAHTAREARRLGYGCLQEGDYLLTEADRIDLPKGVDVGDRARVLHWGTADVRIIRLFGWHCEGERACDACGLHPCDLPEFALCSECDQCPECGHDPSECWTPGETMVWTRQRFEELGDTSGTHATERPPWRHVLYVANRGEVRAVVRFEGRDLEARRWELTLDPVASDARAEEFTKRYGEALARHDAAVAAGAAVEDG